MHLLVLQENLVIVTTLELICAYMNSEHFVICLALQWICAFTGSRNKIL